MSPKAVRREWFADSFFLFSAFNRGFNNEPGDGDRIGACGASINFKEKLSSLWSFIDIRGLEDKKFSAESMLALSLQSLESSKTLMTCHMAFLFREVVVFFLLEH